MIRMREITLTFTFEEQHDQEQGPRLPPTVLAFIQASATGTADDQRELERIPMIVGADAVTEPGRRGEFPRRYLAWEAQPQIPIAERLMLQEWGRKIAARLGATEAHDG